MIEFPFGFIDSTRHRVEPSGGLPFLAQLNEPFARAQSQFEVPEEVQPQKPVDPALCRNVMAQNFQPSDPLPDSGSQSHGDARGIFNAARSNNTLALKQGIGRVIAKPDQDICSNDREAGPSIKHDGNQKRECAISRFKEKIDDDNGSRGIIGHSGHENRTPVSRERLPVK
jgi:hypothetical protein